MFFSKNTINQNKRISQPLKSFDLRDSHFACRMHTTSRQDAGTCSLSSVLPRRELPGQRPAALPAADCAMPPVSSRCSFRAGSRRSCSSPGIEGTSSWAPQYLAVFRPAARPPLPDQRLPFRKLRNASSGVCCILPASRSSLWKFFKRSGSIWSRTAQPGSLPCWQS